jgi:RNA polymerase sigma factor (sigma-70 family)
VDHRGDKEYWQLIWDKFRSGDSQAFETIYTEFIDILFAYGSKITNNKDLLEDAIQDVFISVYTYGKKLRQPELLEFYLFKTLKRILIRKIKENQRFEDSSKPSDEFELKFPFEDIETDVWEKEKRLQLLHNEVQSLDAKKRELLFLKFNSGLTYAEIGELLNIKPDTAKKQVKRIIGYFKNNMREKIIELFLLCYRT